MEETASFGYWLRRRRKALDLTQETLAKRLGCAVVTIRKIEADQRRPSRQIAGLLAEILAIPAEDRPLFIACARGILSPLNLSLTSQPAEPGLPGPPRSLPSPLTAFIGRESQVQEVMELARQSDVRLLCLTGPGGVGKTRLALEAARNLLPDFKDGVYFVDLSLVQPQQQELSNRIQFVARAIAKIIKIQDLGYENITEGLLSQIQKKHILLVLDNFEQLVDTAVLVSELLSAAPNLKVIATSRQALNLSGEHVYWLSSLADSEAVQLFMERAKAVDRHFSLLPENEGTILQICRRLEGIPLALELAAVHIVVYPPKQMLSMLEHRLSLLVGGPRDLPVRQQTLRSTLDWSFDLLSEDERCLFRRLAVFVDGISVDAAAWVCDPDRNAEQADAAQNDPALQNILTSLYQKSLLYACSEIQEARFFMLDTIREYALEHLQANHEVDIMRQRHLDFFLQFAQTLEEQVHGGDISESDWLDRISLEYENIIAALTWSLDGHSPRQGARLASAMPAYWYKHGHTGEGRSWLEYALTYCPQADDLRASILANIGFMIGQEGDYTLARSYLDESISIFRGLEPDHERDLAYALHVLGHIRFDQKEYPESRALFSESLARYQSCNDQTGIADILGDLGLAAYHLGDNCKARLYFEEGLDGARRQNSENAIAVHLVRLGDLARIENDLETAEEMYSESLTLCREARDIQEIALSLQKLGQIARQRRHFDSARTYFIESLILQNNQGSRQGIAACLAGLGGWYTDTLQMKTAACLFGAAERLLRESASALAPADQVLWEQDVQALRKWLDAGELKTAWENGSLLGWEQTICSLNIEIEAS